MFEVIILSGTDRTAINAVDWAREATERGVTLFAMELVPGDDLSQVLFVQRVEDHNIVNTVEKFRPEMSLKDSHHGFTAHAFGLPNPQF